MKTMPRLEAVAGCVPRESIVADIGTDHAYLPVFLVLKGISPKVIAVEKSANNMVVARRNLERLGLGEKVELRVGEGLSVIDREDGVEALVIAGLGGITICHILQRGREKLDWFGCFILQPQGDVYALRRWLTAHNLCLTHERLVRDNNRFYEILVVQHGKQQPVKDPLLLEVGPCLVQGRDPLLPAYLEDKINRCRRIAAALNSPRYAGRKKYFLEKEARLKEVLWRCRSGCKL